MAFQWSNRISKIYNYWIWLPFFLVSLLWIPLLRFGGVGYLPIILLMVSISGTSAAFLFFTWNERSHPRKMSAIGILTPEHVRTYYDSMSERWGVPVRNHIDPDHVEIYFMVGLIATGFDYYPKRKEIVTGFEDNVTRNALDRIDDGLRSGSFPSVDFDDANITALKRYIRTTAGDRGAILESDGENWNRNIYQTWMYAVIIAWFIGGFIAWITLSIGTAIAVGVDPRFGFLFYGVIVILLAYPTIKFFADRDERKGTFRSPERYKLSPKGLLYGDKLSNIVGHFYWKEIRSFSVSPLIKVLRIVPKRGYVAGSFYGQVDPMEGWKINEYRFILKRDDLRAFRENYEIFGHPDKVDSPPGDTRSAWNGSPSLASPPER